MKVLLSFFLIFFAIIVKEKISAQVLKFDVKQIEKSMVKIDEGVYASQFEVTNALYNEFLSELKQQNRIQEYNIAKIDTILWDVNRKVYSQYYHSHPAYSHYPVVNISFKGAELFCEWLTSKYNEQKNKKLDNIVFKLPTEEDWEKAAYANKSFIYPWGSNELNNKKGIPNANFNSNFNNVKTEMNIDDNPDILNPVKSNTKNSFGIYNMGGNAAEFIQPEGYTKGGSWADESDKLKIKSKDSLSEGSFSSPSIGFRFFMYQN
jgi:formylglycine-generating enzyme required for sulfatase activity